MCNGDGCRNVMCIVSKDQPRGCLLKEPIVEEPFVCPACCRKTKKVFKVSAPVGIYKSKEGKLGFR